ncbi:DASS family sodium-coupled anion symporter [Luteolibacter yonseiensis]|uniref:DASS family sodium-coupled anion symporter n=1 Tax=Luteolibacter yonseiensis TaxID=1144680 RepID=A0A934R563_9BACT|nr:DASS family sodium-coupled anion symporter [Luteolibacter yonseiensis]MBK1815670.1 DASS family sodium-coupled anion symporter [Luteolibacter yonseiensis]
MTADESGIYPSGKRHTLLLLTAVFLLAGLAFGLRLDPTSSAMQGLDPVKLRVGLGIFACIAFLWLTEALPLAITALLVPVLGCGFGLMDVKSSLAGFADPLIFLFLGGFAMAAALSSQGLDRWIANRIVIVGKGDFLIVSYLIFATTAAISMWVSNTATAAMMLPLALGILRQMPEGPASARNAVYLLLGVAYAASVGGIGTVVGTPPNGIAAAKLGIGFVEWLKFGIPAVLVLMPLLVVVLKWRCRPETLAMPRIENLGYRFDRPRLTALAIFALTATSWILSEPIAKALGVASSFDTLVALVAMIALVSTRVVSWKEIDKGTDWGVLILFGGGITLSTILSQTGTSLYMARIFSDAVGGWPVPLIIGGVILFTIFLTELTSNTALAALMVPIFFSISGELGVLPAKIILPLTIAASTGFMMPVGTPPNAIVFATGKIPQREMIRTGFVLNLVFVVALTLLAQVLF